MALDNGSDTQMNVFEDLVVELKEENLLENTVMDHGARSINGAPLKASDISVSVASNGNHKASKVGNREDYRPAPNAKQVKKQLSEQLSALQLIEFVLSAAENLEGSATQPFDDLPVKKAFHRYNQAGSDQDSNDFFEAESELISSLSDWEDNLAKRDSQIQPSAIRLYTETANPPLSPQALFAMLRFYRGVPVSEWSYTKFDFIVTRLFSKLGDGDKRAMICSRSEIVRHLTERYAEWGMDGFKSLPADDPEIAMLGLSFDDFGNEAERTANLKTIVSSQLCERFLEHKRSAGALFFIPKITAAAIEANLKISSKIIDLIGFENEKGGAGRISGLNEALMSEAIARTVNIGAVIDSDVEELPERQNSRQTLKTPRTERPRNSRSNSQKVRGSSLFGVNKWLLMATILCVIASAGIYVWAEYFTTETAVNNGVKTAQIDNPDLKQFIQTAKISGSMLYAVATPEFEQMKEDQQREFLRKLQNDGVQKGYDRVSLMSAQGKILAYATKDRIEFKAH